MIHQVSTSLAGRTLTIETGKLAKQAQGSVVVSYGDTRVLVTACMSSKPKAGIDFFPLTVEFAERFYAAGKIPGGFHRREGRPTSDATLSARLIDRPIRPLFPEGFFHEVQVVATVLSLDKEADVDICAAIGASAALHISEIPFNGPTAGVRVGRINGEYTMNPSWDQVQNGETDMEIFITGTSKAIMMVEGGAREVPEEQVLEAIVRGHAEIKNLVKIVEELRQKCGKEKFKFTPVLTPDSIKKQVETLARADLNQALRTKEKATRYALVDAAKDKTLEAILASVAEDQKAETEKLASSAFDTLQYNLMREMILTDKIRIDGRDTKTIRNISCEVGVLPRPHGSALFTRGETQVLSTVTLGTGDDEQIIDTMFQNTMKQFMLHYNFPPYSVGECGRMGGQSRREIGHGALAERSIKAMMPKHEEFPYTVRIVCETLESNGSSSMGSVCAASMALMHAGVKYPKPVGGIAMGLIKEGDRVAVLSDILGDEDHLGDMDFKVAGTKDGVTGIQMDIKIEGVDEAIMKQALLQAREGRLHILGKMAEAITEARGELSQYAPQITSIMVPKDRIGEVIGPSGKVIKDIIAKTGCKIDINDDGRVNIASNDGAAAKKAIEMIQGIIAEAEIGKTYSGVVKRIVDFGAFVEILPKKDGLLHISEIAHERVASVEDLLAEGDTVEVRVIDVDRAGKIRLSRKALLPVPAGMTAAPAGSGDRGQRPASGGGRPGGAPRPAPRPGGAPGARPSGGPKGGSTPPKA